MTISDSVRTRIRAAPSFEGVDPDLLDRALAMTSPRHLNDEEFAFHRGEDGSKAYLILNGMVRISTLGESGKRIVVEIFREHELFGELGVIDNAARTADAIAYGPAELLVIPNTAFNLLLDNSAAFGKHILRMVTKRLRRTYSLLEDASLLNLELRLAKQVLYLMGLGATGGQRVRIHSRMHQEDLADLLGATSRSIITILNKWRTEQLATFDGKSAQLTILDLDRFRALVEPDARPAI
ncbi:MAG TPA: Crp/Fnr family transcriptional regulator [Acidisphaera sp.]|nr:Crp/Fnr family transcriptional regulator [Acidisphaera sp.]